MGQRRHLFGRWTPDQPALENALVDAQNMVPSAHQGRNILYRPVGSLEEVVGSGGSFGAIGAYVRGDIHVIDRGGLVNNFAGDATKLYRIQSGAWADVSKGGGYSLGTGSRWEMDVFTSAATNRRAQIIACCIEEPIQFFEVGAGGSTLFADLAAAAPKARHLAIIKAHVVVGYTNDPTDGTVPNRIWYPAQGNAASWPTPGSDAAVSALSGHNTLDGNHGQIMGLVGGSDWGTIFQETCVRRADWVGGSVVFEISKPISERGLAVQGLAIPIGNRILFFSQDGWFIFDGNSVEAVGEGVVDNWFKRDFQWDLRHRVSFVVDPDRKIAHIGYCGLGSSGTPNRILHYYWPGNAFAYSNVDHDRLSLVVNPGPNLSMDRLPSPIPDFLTGSWDDIQTATRVFGGFTAARKLGTFSGPNPAAVLQTGALELTPGKRSMSHFVRPQIGQGTPTIAVAKLAAAEDTPSFSSPSGVTRTGKCNARADARYHAFRMSIAAGWTGSATGLDIYFDETSTH